MGEIDDALARAAGNTATRPIPKSAQARMRTDCCDPARTRCLVRVWAD